jgi:hypothetical protein
VRVEDQCQKCSQFAARQVAEVERDEWKAQQMEIFAFYEDVVRKLIVIRSEQDRLRTLRPESEWHEDHGTVLWWHIPVQEPPHVGCGLGMGEREASGAPTRCAQLLKEGWLTHWSPIPNAALPTAVRLKEKKT